MIIDIFHSDVVKLVVCLPSHHEMKTRKVNGLKAFRINIPSDIRAQLKTGKEEGGGVYRGDKIKKNASLNNVFG